MKQKIWRWIIDIIIFLFFLFIFQIFFRYETITIVGSYQVREKDRLTGKVFLSGKRPSLTEQFYNK